MKSNNFESLNDNAIDVMGYGLILGLLIGDEWESLDIEEVVNRRLLELKDIFLKKREDYGTEDITVAGIHGVLTRLQDKVSRLKNLTDYQKQSETGTQPLLCKTLSDDATGIKAPAIEGDCGYDITIEEDIIIPAKSESGKPIDVPSRCAVKIPSGFWGMIINRSSTSRKRGLAVVPGVIDEGYTGELFACTYNLTNEEVQLKKGERIAQLILMPRFTPPVVAVAELPTTARGERGFGSTDK